MQKYYFAPSSKKRDLKVTDVRVQYDIKNLQGRSIRLDILAEDEAGKL